MSGVPFRYFSVIDEICELAWGDLSPDDMIAVVWAYYFVSVQFRENLLIARCLYPNDKNLQQLEAEECTTDNLSPWSGVAKPGELLDHDEFLRRVLTLQPTDEASQFKLRRLGEDYLASIRRVDDRVRAASVS